MHMADALVSPAVGGTMWAVSLGAGAWSAAKVRRELDGGKLPLMGVAGAFVFAAQMINFTIPGTGSSGHIGGGILLAALLGPQAALLTIASVLVIQALFFADGGLLALGCNVFNMGVLPAFVAFPLTYRWIAGSSPSRSRLVLASVTAAVVALQLGAFAVVMETAASGVSELPFGTFLLLMQPIHLAIGVVEGFATAAILLFVRESRPEILESAASGGHLETSSIKGTLVALGILALFVGGALSWFASTHPDGLEWSIARVTGSEELSEPSTAAHRRLAEIQRETALLPDYELPEDERAEQSAGDASDAAWPAPDTGTSVAGLVGSALTLVFVVLIAVLLRWVGRRRKA